MAASQDPWLELADSLVEPEEEDPWLSLADELGGAAPATAAPPPAEAAWTEALAGQPTLDPEGAGYANLNPGTMSLAELEALPTHGDVAQQAASSATQGLAELPAGVLDSIAIAQSWLDKSFGVKGAKPADEQTAHKFAQGVRDLALQLVPPAPEETGLQDSFLASKLPGALGQGVGFIGAGAAGQLAKVPSMLSAAALGGAQNAQAQFWEALGESGDEEEAYTAFALGMGVGATEAAGIGGLLGRLSRRTGGALTRAMAGAMREGAEEGAQEGIQTVLNNTIAHYTYDDEREFLANAVEGATLGMLSGGILGGVLNAATAPSLGASEAQGTARATEGPYDATEGPYEGAALAPEDGGEALPSLTEEATPPIDLTGDSDLSFGEQEEAGESNIAEDTPDFMLPAPAEPETPTKAPKKGSGRKFPSGARGGPETVMDYVVERGGIDLRGLGPGNEAGDFWARLRGKESGRKGLPKGFLYGPDSKAKTSGLTPDQIAEELWQDGFTGEDGGRPTPDEVLAWLEDELAGNPHYSPEAQGVAAQREAARASGEQRGPGVEESGLPLPPKVVKEVEVADPWDPDAEITSETQQLDEWLADRQEADTEADIDARKKEDRLKVIAYPERKGRRSVSETLKEGTSTEPSRKKARELDAAMHLYIDLGQNAEAEFAKYGDKLTEEQRRIYELSQNLPPEAQALADEIATENEVWGRSLQDDEIIATVRENYSARIWKSEEQGFPASGRGKFTTKTGRQKARTLDSILHGWAVGKELAVPGAIQAQNTMRRQTAQVVNDKNLIRTLKAQGVVSDKREGDDWRQIEHPNFQAWVYAGSVAEGMDQDGEPQAGGPGFMVAEDGTVLRRVPLYGAPGVARQLNNILGQSKLNELPGVETLTKYNAQAKATVLFSSLFHHIAFLNSYVFGTPTSTKNVRPRWAMREGKKAIESFTPELRELVRGGLTLGRLQELDAMELHEKTKVGEVIDKVAEKLPGGEAIAAAKAGLLKLRDQQADFLFKTMGPQLKATTALLEYRHLLHKYRNKIERGALTVEDVAQMAAEIANEDFGGLNLERMRRNPSLQHAMRLALLAPDWTESNVRSFFGMMRKGEEGQVRRMLWGRVLVRGAIGATLFNAVMALMDDDEDFLGRYKAAFYGPDDHGLTEKQRDEYWKKMHWLDVDVTPIYRKLGGNSPKRKYFKLIGHFKDPIKWLSDPVGTAKGKESIVGSILHEAMTGDDWKGQRFTTWRELLGIDFDKGLYKGKGKYGDKGDPKYGLLRGNTVAWQGRTDAKGGPIEYEQVPSFALAQAAGLLPVQAQSALGFLLGELDGFDALARSIGLKTSSTYPKD